MLIFKILITDNQTACKAIKGPVVKGQEDDLQHLWMEGNQYNNNNFIYIALLKTMFTKCFDRTKQEKQFSFTKEK